VITAQGVVDTELRNNGGFVPTLALVPASPALDQVPIFIDDCAAGVILSITDARGVARPQNGNCDIGAFEFGPTFRRALRPLAIGGAGSGHGTVSGAGLDCAIAAGAGSGRCSAEYLSGTVVDLIATAAPGSIFVGWEGDPECRRLGPDGWRQALHGRLRPARSLCQRVGEPGRAGSCAGRPGKHPGEVQRKVRVREHRRPDDGDGHRGRAPRRGGRGG
jgi:hypothetical protein